jgi:hypothetical protein
MKSLRSRVRLPPPLLPPLRPPPPATTFEKEGPSDEPTLHSNIPCPKSRASKISVPKLRRHGNPIYCPTCGDHKNKTRYHCRCVDMEGKSLDIVCNDESKNDKVRRAKGQRNRRGLKKHCKETNPKITKAPTRLFDGAFRFMAKHSRIGGKCRDLVQSAQIVLANLETLARSQGRPYPNV